MILKFKKVSVMEAWILFWSSGPGPRACTWSVLLDLKLSWWPNRVLLTLVSTSYFLSWSIYVCLW